MTIMNEPKPDLTQMTPTELFEYRQRLTGARDELAGPRWSREASDEFERRGDALLAEERRRGSLRDAQEAQHSGEYALSPEAASTFWYLHAHGVEPGYRPAGREWVDRWSGYADYRVSSDKRIQEATSLDGESVRRALTELEETGFIRRSVLSLGPGDRVQLNAYRLTVPEDWCVSCHTRGEHECKPDRPCPDHVQAYREKFGDDAARRYFETDDLDTAGHKHR